MRGYCPNALSVTGQTGSYFILAPGGQTVDDLGSGAVARFCGLRPDPAQQARGNMSPTRRSITPRPEGVCPTALLSAVPALAHAQDAAPAAFNTASWVLIFVAFYLALALVRQCQAGRSDAGGSAGR